MMTVTKQRWRRLLVVLRLSAAAWLFAPVGCAPLPQFPFSANADLAPPRILTLGFDGPTVLRVGFDEPCVLVEDSLYPGETLSTTSVSAVLRPISAEDQPIAPATELRLLFDPPPPAAIEHAVEAQVVDDAGNHLRFVARFYGLNGFLPAMIINEFTTQGSGNHPDLVEIRVLTDGNLAGSCILEGTPDDWDDRYVFPDLWVSAGDFIVVHFKPAGVPEELDETTDPSRSGGNDATPTAWDFWVTDGNGLSGNNGVLTLCENPIGGVLDAVLYSNRTSTSDDRYRGFGSTSVMDRADYLAAAGAWESDGPIRPEDAVDPEDSTATRSISRGSDGRDSNRRADWHITPTRGLSPGATNTDDVYGN